VFGVMNLSNLLQNYEIYKILVFQEIYGIFSDFHTNVF
jgi:hypothetical protein